MLYRVHDCFIQKSNVPGNAGLHAFNHSTHRAFLDSVASPFFLSSLLPKFRQQLQHQMTETQLFGKAAFKYMGMSNMLQAIVNVTTVRFNIRDQLEIQQ